MQNGHRPGRSPHPSRHVECRDVYADPHRQRGREGREGNRGRAEAQARATIPLCRQPGVCGCVRVCVCVCVRARVHVRVSCVWSRARVLYARLQGLRNTRQNYNTTARAAGMSKGYGFIRFADLNICITI